MPSPPNMTQPEALAAIAGRTATSIAVASVLAGVSLQAMYDAAKRGEFETFRVGTRVVVPVAPLLKRLGIAEVPA